MPYTAFYCLKSYIKNNKENIIKFNKAINKALDYTHNTSSKKLAKIVLNQFPDSSLNEIETIIERYKKADTWLPNTTINEELYKNLENIMIDNNLLDNYVDFNKLVINLNE